MRPVRDRHAARAIAPADMPRQRHRRDVGDNGRPMNIDDAASQPLDKAAEGSRPEKDPTRSDRPGAASTSTSTSKRPRRTRRGSRRGSAGRAGSGWRGYTPEELASRAESVPPIVYPEELPVSARREEIAAAIRDHQVVIVAGETGSGKTTQLPKICLELGRGLTGMIGHTQPRRIAARSVAERIASELGTPIGRQGVVGYQVRFTEEVGASTLIKLMTDGILLAEIQSDPSLSRYDTIIVDEAHERSLNIDFILGYLARLLPRRPDLKVIITSATIDSQRFAEHFGAHRAGDSTEPAPIIEVSGRTYPVEIRYRPLQPDPPAQARLADPGGQSPPEGASAPAPPAAPGELTEAELEALTSPDPAVRAAARARREALRAGSPGPSPQSPQSPQPPSSSSSSRAATGGRQGSPLPEGAEPTEPRDQVTGILEAVDELMAEPHGDILVFLAGERDIRDTEAALIDHLGARYSPDGRSSAPGGVEIVPLYSRLSAAEQHRVFEAHTMRRIVLATNVAETSLTVPGIRYVIDPGVARISRYSNRTKVQRLPIEPVSRASADQRAGRCGRVADGIAIRLYSQADFEARPRYTEPEILRTSLASVILQMAALGLGAVGDFPFLDAPDSRQVRSGLQLLTEIGAIEPEAARPRSGGPRLTDIGRRLARLPIDPRLGRMLLEAGELGCAGEVLVIVAALSIQDVRERPADRQEASDAMHRRFADPTSDFLTYLNLWRYLRTQSRELSGSAFRRMCRAEFLHYLRVREWQDVHTQLRQMSRQLGLSAAPVELPTARSIRAATQALEPGSHAAQIAHGGVAAAVVALGRSADTPDADAIHRSLLLGLLSNVGTWDERRREYAGARGTRFAIWPGSGLRRKTYDWVMSAELVETSRLFARTVAKVDSRWIEEAAERAGLARRVYGEPYWSVRHGAAMVHEKVLLYGMTLAADRPVPLSAVGTQAARDVAREMFLRKGLIEGGWHARHAFVERNRELVEELGDVERRRREHGLLADDAALFDFYDDRVPEEVTSAAAFDAWWKDARRSSPDLLDFTRELLLPGGDDTSGFPDTWVQADLTLPLDYVFEPGHRDDGVAVRIPVEVLGRLEPEGFDWLVPGLRPELCVATIRALPKRVRRQLVPAPDVGAQIWQALAEGYPTPSGASAPAVSFQEAFCQVVRRLREVEISGEDWDEAAERLPDHLRMAFVSIDAQGRALGRSKDLVELQRRLSGSTQDAVRSAVRGALAQAMAEAVEQAGGARAGGGSLSDSLSGARAGGGSGRGGKGRRGRPRAGGDPGSKAGGAGGAPGTESGGQSTPAVQDGAIRAGMAEREALEDWPSGIPGLEEPEASTIPATVESTGAAGFVVRGYPALVAAGGAARLRTSAGDPAHRAGRAQAGGGRASQTPSPSADLVILPDAVDQQREHPAGVTALALARTALPVGRVTSRWSGQESLTLAASPYRSTEALVADLQLAAARAVAGGWARRTGWLLAEVRRREVFAELVAAMREELEDEVHRIAQIVVRTLSAQREVDRVVGAHSSLSLLTTLQEVREHAAELVFDGFITATPADRLVHLPRYLKALALRVDRAASSPSAASQDAALSYQVGEALAVVDRARARAAGLPPDARREAALDEARWMVEELRVSLFAQTLGTSQKVSPQRITKLAASIA
ncbi:ATP-dependent RNA helicase HrpA [Actinomyces slackii]|uniref:ATP-dependent RNA helicase HrpA n=2 Tax=Actinomyces slackii TaxID=52774 RepID=A0A3S4SS74_9ACTO|nr:ATP-dependent RNA helicase HrpA [Actinomyces slackii]